MKFAFNVKNCVVKLAMTETQGIDGKYRPELRGSVYPFASHFHSVKFEVNDKGTSIGFGGNTFSNGMGAKIVEAAVIAQEQVTHFSSLLEEMRDCKGDPSPVFAAMQEGRYGLAAIILSMIPDANQDGLSPKIKQNLPEDSNVVSVVTAVMAHSSFAPAFALLDKSAEEAATLDPNQTEAYLFAKYMRDVFASGLPSGELAQEGAQNDQERNTYMTAKMKEFIGA